MHDMNAQDMPCPSSDLRRHHIFVVLSASFYPHLSIVGGLGHVGDIGRLEPSGSQQLSAEIFNIWFLQYSLSASSYPTNAHIRECRTLGCSVKLLLVHTA